MGRPRKVSSPERSNISPKPAMTREGREKQLISLSMDEAEYQIRNHTASSQIITHFLKLGTTLAELEKEKLIRETELLKVKAEQPQQNKYIEDLCKNAITAMARYSGHSEDVEEDDY